MAAGESDLRYVSHEILPGAVKPEGLPYVYDNGGEAETLSILLEDPVTHVQVTLYYTVFENRDAITRYAVIHNASGVPGWSWNGRCRCVWTAGGAITI